MRKFIFPALGIIIGSIGFAAQSKAGPVCFGERAGCKNLPDYAFREKFIEASSGDCKLSFMKTEARENALFATFRLEKKRPVYRLEIGKQAVKIADINVAKGSRLYFADCKLSLQFEMIFDNPDAVLVRVNEEREPSSHPMN